MRRQYRIAALLVYCLTILLVLPSAASALDDAFTARVNDRKRRLTPSILDSSLIKEKCETVRTKLASIYSRYSVTVSLELANKLMPSFEDKSVELQQRGIDTKTYDNSLVELEKLNNTYIGTLNAFFYAINDAYAINCTEDPTGFMVSLDDTRQAARQMQAAQKARNTYMRLSIEPEVDQFIKKIEVN